MKKLTHLLLLLATAHVLAQSPTINVIPRPVEVQALTGTFILTKATTIAYNQAAAKSTADMLVRHLGMPTGWSLAAKEGKAANIQLNLNATPIERLGKEGYTLEAGPKGVIIAANQPAGLFYGVQTLLQLLPKEIESPKAVASPSGGGGWSVPALRITDYPRFAWRGLMLDVSRHFFSKQDVKAYIDEMVRYKYNTFHWHLTDDNGWRIEIKSLPKLTEVGAWRVERSGHFGDRAPVQPNEKATVGGFYTHDDIREIVQYAAERHVTIVPEIETPGHCMAALAAYPELSCTDQKVYVDPGTNFADWFGNGTFRMNMENTLNPADEKVYEFLDKVFTEVAQLFPGQYIHVGGDECYKGYWKANPECQALMKRIGSRHVEDLQGYFMGKVQKILTAKGKKMLGWDEILEGGIASGATVMSWRGMSGGIEAAHLGHEVVMTPTTFAYLDYTQGDPTIDPPIYARLRCQTSYSFEPVPDGVDARFILGGQGNLWTEQVPNLRYAYYMTYPRAWALSEVLWSQKQGKDWGKFSNRMEAHFQRYDVAGKRYSSAVYDPIVRTKRENDKLVLLLESEMPNLALHYSTDDTMPDNYSLQYSAPVALPEGPITLRVQAYRGGQPIGHLITLKRGQLEERVGR